MDGPAIAAFLDSLTADATVVPSGAAWRTPPTPGVESNAVLVWNTVRMGGIVTRLRAAGESVSR